MINSRETYKAQGLALPHNLTICPMMPDFDTPVYMSPFPTHATPIFISRGSQGDIARLSIITISSWEYQVPAPVSVHIREPPWLQLRSFEEVSCILFW